MTYVHTELGTISGACYPHYEVFKGIPYAKAPIGDLRFKTARPYHDTLDGFQALEFGPVPIQPPNSLEAFFNVSPQHYKQDEACLTLNVWRPKQTSSNDRLPVIVYFYGGSFVNGHSAQDLYHPHHLVSQEKVIVVTFNYRLGALGFLDWASINDSWDNNLGLSDQICALQWVHQHISDFGGDPQLITAMGQSAGAMSIQALLLHKTAHAMIHRAVLLSGPLQWMSSREGKRKAQEFETLKTQYFPNIPWHQLTSNHILTLMAHQQMKYGKTKGLEFLYAPIQTASFHHTFEHLRLPVLVGQTKSEGDIYIKSERHTLSPQQFQKVLRRQNLDVPPTHQIQTAQQQRDWITKYYFHQPIQRLTQQLAQATTTWTAIFAWSRPSHPNYATSYHILDVPFWLGHLDILTAHGLSLTHHEYQLSHQMIHDLCYFAATGTCSWQETQIYK